LEVDADEMKVLAPIFAVVAVFLLAQDANATSYQIGPVSQQVGPSKASVGASVEASGSSPGTPGARNVSSESLGGGAPESAPPEGGEATGPARANGEACQSLPETAVPCYGVVALPPEEAEGKAGAAPPVNPAALAATAASRLSLLAGQVEASPAPHAAGLTGAASWFWLAPSPTPRSLSVAARGEHVTVTAAVGTVRWNFGDGKEVDGGPGVPYQPESVPPGAVRHIYNTRCLPGDRGHDPNVLPSCGANGYELRATVEWTVSFQATGPITTAGGLPTRSTETTVAYPVSEARAFLTKAGEK
jgi:hypothetical protein